MFRQRIDEHFELRALQAGDAAALAAAIDINRTHLAEFLPWAPHSKTVADSLAFINDTVTQAQNHTALAAAIWIDGELVGNIGLDLTGTGGGHHEAGEIGYWLAESASGRGIMSRCVQAIIEWAWLNTELEHLLIHARPNNPRSIAVAERLGFSYEGVDKNVERVGDQIYDLNRYTLSRPH